MAEKTFNVSKTKMNMFYEICNMFENIESIVDVRNYFKFCQINYCICQKSKMNVFYEFVTCSLRLERV